MKVIFDEMLKEELRELGLDPDNVGFLDKDGEFKHLYKLVCCY